MKPAGTPGQYRDVDPGSPVCRECQRSLDAATKLHGGGKPGPGAVSICFYCGTLSIFHDDRLLRAPTDAELAEIQGSAQWPLIRAAMERFSRGRQR